MLSMPTPLHHQHTRRHDRAGNNIVQAQCTTIYQKLCRAQRSSVRLDFFSGFACVHHALDREGHGILLPTTCDLRSRQQLDPSTHTLSSPFSTQCRKTRLRSTTTRERFQSLDRSSSITPTNFGIRHRSFTATTTFTRRWGAAQSKLGF
jgi:hypothetical protein